MDRLVEIIAEPVRCDDKEYLLLLAVALIDTPISYLRAPSLKLIFETADIRHEHGRTILGRIATVDRKAEPRPVALEDNRRDRLGKAFNFHHAKMLAIPSRGGIQIGDWQGQDVLLVGICPLELRLR
jgi:hypothetical protein